MQVSGPASIVDRLTALETEPVDLADLAASTQKTVGLVRTDQLSVKPETVVVEISVAPIVTTRDFKRLPVVVRNVDRPFQLKPARVNLTVRGPQRVVQNLTLDESSVYVDGGSCEPGEHMVEAEVALPPGVELVETRSAGPAPRNPGRLEERSTEMSQRPDRQTTRRARASSSAPTASAVSPTSSR